MKIQEYLSEVMVCPHTAQEVTAEQFIVNPILGSLAGVVVWWHCPACQCWHMSEIKSESAKALEKLLFSPQRIMPYQLN